MILALIPDHLSMVIALILFLLTYALLLALPKRRPFVALGSALLFIVLGYIPLPTVFFAIDWNVILMIGGTMGLVALFIESKMPAFLADLVMDRANNVKVAIIALSLFAAIISAFIDNVATVLIVAPIALTIAKKLKMNPVPAIIAISVASNLEGAATLVGDTTSILLGGYAQMDFLDFFFYQGKPGLFFIVQVGLVAATAVLFFIFRHAKEKIHAHEKTKVTNYFPSYLMVSLLVLLIFASFIPNKPAITNGLICVFLMLVGIVYQMLIMKQKKVFNRTIGEIDLFTISLLIGLFIVIRGITNAGLIDAIAQGIGQVSGGNVFVVYTIIVLLSVLLSAFIDNIPYVATMLPVMGLLATRIGLSDPTVLYFGLLVGATLGGNLTPIGASANITAIGILRKEGYKVTTRDFMRIGVPYTLAAVVTGYLLVWIFFA